MKLLALGFGLVLSFHVFAIDGYQGLKFGNKLTEEAMAKVGVTPGPQAISETQMAWIFPKGYSLLGEKRGTIIITGPNFKITGVVIEMKFNLEAYTKLSTALKEKYKVAKEVSPVELKSFMTGTNSRLVSYYDDAQVQLTLVRSSGEITLGVGYYDKKTALDAKKQFSGKKDLKDEI